ncbi:RutC family protein [Pigmentiphaga humi]|uniref:RutC family protein n=1 Tax=Pigmentiphaga humi TaxID=2478468 RepID=A0A3P4B9P6_9BURK|nr:RidA family protein [Pigmentiphaga humi]VCU72320.1 RutC family protein [Pigmentiphaga humi]
MASASSARVSIQVDGLERKSPAPTACRIGKLVMSGGIYGRNPATRELAEDAQAQTSQLFENIHAVMQAAGGTVADIIKIEFDVSDMTLRAMVNRAWETMFPDAGSRPARHVVPAGHLPEGAHVRCELYAVLDEVRP